MKTEIKPFADIQLANRYVKVFIEPDVDEETAKKALNNFIEKFDNEKIIPELKNEPIDFLIIQNNRIIASHKTNNNKEPHCVWLKNIQLEETVKTIGMDNTLDKYKIKVPINFYGMLPIENNIEDGKED